MSQEFKSKIFDVAAKNTFCRVKSILTGISVRQDAILTHSFLKATSSMPINASTRISKGKGEGVVVADTNCYYEEGDFTEHTYERVMKQDEFVDAVHAAIQSQEL